MHLTLSSVVKELKTATQLVDLDLSGKFECLDLTTVFKQFSKLTRLTVRNDNFVVHGSVVRAWSSSLSEARGSGSSPLLTHLHIERTHASALENLDVFPELQELTFRGFEPRSVNRWLSGLVTSQSNPKVSLKQIPRY